MTAEQDWWPCCDCCSMPPGNEEPGDCYFNGTRDRHTWPCEDCDKSCECCGDVHPPTKEAP